MMEDPFWLNMLRRPFSGFGLLSARFLFRFRHDEIPVCHTRIMRQARGFPWDYQVGIHPLPDGKLEITPIRIPPPPDEEE